MPNIHTNISFALVNIPVVMNPIIKNNDTSFNQLHKKCLHQIKYVKYCPHCKKDLKEVDIIKGYKYDYNKYLTFTKEELKNLTLPNEKEIEIVAFISMSEVDPYYFEKSYFLEAEGKSKVYGLFCEALKKTKKVALCKTVLGSKFYYAILRFKDRGIIMNTLYFDEEINVPDIEIKKDLKPKELEMAIKLIESLSAKFEPEKYKDEYQNKIKEAINAKIDGKEIKGVKKENKKQISDLMKALEASLKENK
jgi:DNA end-binding protein Ku